MNLKSLYTNLAALACIGAGWALPLEDPARSPLLGMGYFALSGALTNWLAVHMLFERVPLLYGSGVIPARFEAFKEAIQHLIMEQFFSEERIAGFLAQQNAEGSPSPAPETVIQHVDTESLFEKLADAIMESPFGGMVGMMGGREALTPLKASVTEKLGEMIQEVLGKLDFTAFSSEDIGRSLRPKIAAIVDARLAELTPQMVKEIVQDMIREHLGWLVVWGGVFGGLIGLVVTAVG